VAEGSIIATIITHHMRTSAANGGDSISGMVVESGIPAPRSTNSHASAASSATPPATIARS
jgi:hypothetical protein